jgi:hypothetical protein
MTSRRRFVGATAIALAAGGLAPGLRAGSAAKKRRPRILLRPGTAQHGNIGDIAHSPGALRLFERYFPEAEFALWPVEISAEARAGILRQFPQLKIVEGEFDSRTGPRTPELRAAWDDADLLLHGSAPGFKGGAYMPAWRAASRKPYGIFGMTDDPVSGIASLPEGGTLAELRQRIASLPPGHLEASTHELLSHAAFVFCRETLTADYLRRQGVRSRVLEFGPDATFALSLQDDSRAATYLQNVQLDEGRFICVIPRLRYTPYHRITGKPATASDRAKDAVNDRTVDRDHAKLRDLIVAWVKYTGLKVLACPEMSYQVALAKQQLVDPLPADVRRNVVWRDAYWQPSEAASVYTRALAVVSFECHSPIISLTNGTPAIYVRQPTDTIKGQMYHDIGVSDWISEVDETSGEILWNKLEMSRANPAAARAKLRAAMARVERGQRRMVGVAREAVETGRA